MDLMLFLKAILLGIVEGITEFLPISSTGHLILTGHFINFEGASAEVFEVVIQLGAILAVCWYYRQRLTHILFNFHRSEEDRRFVWLISMSFLPSVVIGLLAYEYIKQMFSPSLVAYMLVIGGIAILAVEKFKPEERFSKIEQVGYRHALLVGLCQCLAMIPGTSRSGATIMGAMMFGLSRKAAAEFSFFLAIPTMLGATLLDMYKNYHLLTPDMLGAIGVGFVVSFIVGLLSVGWLLRFLENHGFVPFAWYRIAVGILMIILLGA